ncbi:hypothetical protein FS837_008293 [Tulasnella sp. UAMH 9824]|nr:hypothetical protein FS837_008293 [Tulasnella sp. UAMH 9824]
MIKIDCRWIAPELALGDSRYQMSGSSDVYSLGCLALAVLAKRQPYADYRTNKGVTDAMARDEQPLPPIEESLWPQERIGELWSTCWERDPAARPSADELKASLESMLR